MVCLFNSNCNSIREDFFELSLEDLYDLCLESVRSHTAKIFLPCLQCFALPDNYVLYGFYQRKLIYDVRMVKQEDGTVIAEEIILKDFPIQRIQVMKDGKAVGTQGILPELFIVYERYSIRFALYHLNCFFQNGGSIEAYCLDHSISIPTFRKWLDWMKVNISILRESGLFQDRNENRKILADWVREIKGSLAEWLARSLRLLNRSLFQRHRMPDNTVYHFFEWSG